MEILREVETALQEHRIDLGLVEGIFRLPNLKYTLFLRDELVAVVRAHSKLDVRERLFRRICRIFRWFYAKGGLERWMCSNVLFPGRI